MSEQIQQKIQMRMRMFDDVFHATIIALERLEHFILSENDSNSLKFTAVNSERDLHDDIQNKPTKKLLYSEVQLQCSTLFFQTKFDDEKLFHKTVSYFLEDLLKWYGGRNVDVPYDDVDRFFIPIVSALDRQVQDVNQIMQTVRKYVCDIDNDISEFSDDEKEKAVLEGFEAFLKAQIIIEERYSSVDEKANISFTVHERGNIKEGLKRLYGAFLSLFDEQLPVLFLEQIRKKYLTQIDFEPTTLMLEKIDALKKSNEATKRDN